MDFEEIESGTNRPQQLLSDGLMQALQKMVDSFPGDEELQKIYTEIVANNEWRPTPTPMQFPF